MKKMTGILAGLLMLLCAGEILLNRKEMDTRPGIGRLLTLLLVRLSWVLFRAGNLNHAFL